MMIKRQVIAFAILGCLFGQPGWAQEEDGPFGLRMGMPLSELGKMEKNSKGELELFSVPKQHPFLKRYTVVATEEAGLCRVDGSAGFSQEVAEMNRQFETVRSQIASRYGKVRDVHNFGEGQLGFSWYKKRAMRKVNLQMITLVKIETRGVVGFVAGFEFNNSRDCKIIEDVENRF